MSPSDLPQEYWVQDNERKETLNHSELQMLGGQQIYTQAKPHHKVFCTCFSARTIQLCALSQVQVARELQNPSQTQKAATITSQSLRLLHHYHLF